MKDKGLSALKLYLTSFLIFIAVGGLLAGVFSSEMTIEESLSSPVRFSVSPSDIQVVSVEIDGKLFPVIPESPGRYQISYLGKIEAGSKLRFHYSQDDISDVDKIRITIPDNRGGYTYDLPHIMTDIMPLQNVTDTLDIGVVGAQDMHQIGFDISTNQVDKRGEVWITFHTGFDVGGISPDSIRYSDDDPTNDADEPVVDSINVIAQTIIIVMDRGTPAAPNSRLSFRIGLVNNETVSGSYTVTVQTLDSLGILVHSPTGSAPFTLATDVLNSVAITPGGDLAVPSDSIVPFSVHGYDQYNNIITGLVFNWAITVDSCGSIDNGIFQANKLGTCYITSTTSGITDSSGLITVTPGRFDRYTLTGYPTTITAGVNFPAPVVVTAYDINNNRIHNYADSIYFFANDDSASFTYDETNRYVFQPADSGRISFAGSNFVLKLAGTRTIGVTNGTDTTNSSNITVRPDLISTFAFAALGTQTAGVAFTLTVNGAKDRYGNSANGNIAIINVPPTGGNSPDGVPPVYNNIVVSDGTGSATQILTNAVPTVLRGTIDVVQVETDTITVRPGVTGSLNLTDTPDTVTAGEALSTDPTVTVKDIYGNISTNYNGTINFGGPETRPAPYTFVPANDFGQVSFPGSQFAFEAVGHRRLMVFNSDSLLSDTSSAIEVIPAAISSFSLSAPVNVTAGGAFTASVSGAVDAFGNAASGTVVIADSSGAGNSPDGSTPSLNNIVVANGSGSAQQILVRAGSARLKGTANGHVQGTGIITVAPAVATELVLSNYPDTITAGAIFPSPARDPTVTVKDTYGNPASNYTGTVTISGISHAAGPHTFIPADNGQYAFDGDLFWFQAPAGLRYLVATDAGNGLIDSSSAIEVYAAAINTFVLSAPANVTAGNPFPLSVASASDIYGNAASGLVIVEDSIGVNNSPDGTAPILNDITVTNGSGSAQQTLVNREISRLKGTSGSVIRGTNDINVRAAAASELLLSNYPDTVTAGQPFPSPASDPVVTVRDTYGNRAVNYIGTVSFSGPETVPLDRQFVAGDSGQVTFDGGDFIFETAGVQHLTVEDIANSLTTISGPIRVLSYTISSFTLSAPTDVVAGTAFSVSVSNAVDQYGNLTSGVIPVSGAGGTGNSPNGSAPTFNDIHVTNGSGSGQQILVLTGTARIKGETGGFVDTTDNITVHPAAFGNIILAGYPDSITAGQTFPSPANDITVTITDLFGNRSTDYTGTISFSGPINHPANYSFIPGDAGQRLFGGSAFGFEQAGRRYLIVSDAGNSLIDSSQFIIVSPDVINHFTLSNPPSATAGIAFNLSISGAVDQFGNLTSGTVDVDTVGPANSPDSTTPVIHDIVVTNGSGSAQQILVRAGSARLRATFGSFADTTNTFTVNPGILGQLVTVVATPQVSGMPFSGVCRITARDNYGNTKTNFDASADTVVVSASNGGPMTNNVLNELADFSSGVADLEAQNVTYNGIGGPVTFSATSESGIIGVSNAVQVGSLHAEDITLDSAQVVRGDTASGSVLVVNYGNLDINITALNLSADGTLFNTTYSPSLPHTVPGGTNMTFNFYFIDSTLSLGPHPVSLIAVGDYTGVQTADTLLNGDTLIVVTSSNLADVSGTLTPQVVSRGGAYSLAIRVHNVGGAAINLADTSYLYFTDGSEEYRAELSQNSFVGPGLEANLIFNSELVNSAFAPGYHHIMFYIYGYDLGGTVVDSIDLSDSILVETAANIAYNSGSIDPDTLLTGSQDSMSVEVHNSGQADLIINPDLTKITFGDGNNQYLAYLDTSSSVRVDTLHTGDTTLTFIRTQLLPDFLPGEYIPQITVAGTQNGLNYSVTIPTETISVFNPGEVRIDSLYTVAPNAPKVNINQSFIIHGFISNLGNEIVDGVRMILSSDGQSRFIDTLWVGTINDLSGVSFDYTITADSLPNLLEAFYCDVDSAVNRVSRTDAPVATPLDNSAVAIIERDAELFLDTLYLSDDSLSTGQEFTVTARVAHLGSNSYTGSNKLAIDFNGDAGFVVADSLTRNFNIGQTVSWQVTAPSSVRPAATARVSFLGNFTDLNDSSTALGADSLLTASIVVTESAAITHRAVLLSPAGALDSVLSTGQSLVVADSLFPTGNIEISRANLILPSGFTSSDPLTRTLTGERITWNIRAGDLASIDSIGFNCWSIDSNTGDSAWDATIWIPVEVVGKATLSLSSGITYPPSAMDRILSPGGFFTVEADVENIGQAAAGEGQLTISFENSGFTLDEPAARTFTPGQPIEWHVTAPDIQILDGTPLTISLTSVPLDSNSEQPAVVLNSSTGFDIILKIELPQLNMLDPMPLSGAAVAGQPVDIYRFTLHNSTMISTDRVALISLAYHLVSNDSIAAPAGVLSSSTLNIDGQSFPGTITDTAMVFQLNPHYIVEPDSSAEITINLTPLQDPSVNSFRISFDSNDMQAKVVIGGIEEQFVDVVQPDGSEFSLQSEIFATLASDFLNSTKVSQNPFLAAEGDLLIGYNLTNDATLDISIYNVYGDVVKEFVATPDNGQGTAGQHYDNTAVTWDGRNSSGDRVLSGVYYVLVNNRTTGENAKLKIAVVW